VPGLDRNDHGLRGDVADSLTPGGAGTCGVSVGVQPGGGTADRRRFLPV